MTRSLPRILLIGILCLPAAVAAQGFDAERFVPAAGATSDFTVESPVSSYHLGVGLGLFLNVADDPVVETDVATGDEISKPLDHALSSDLIASIGFFDWSEIGLHLPVRLLYSGDDLAVGGSVLTGAAGVGDLRLVPKFTLLSKGDADTHLVAGFALPMSLPSGNADALRGADGVTIEPKLLLLAQFGALNLSGNLGFLWRSEKPPGLPIGNELRFALSAGYELTPDALSLHGEIFGGKQLSAPVDGADFPLEFLGGIRYLLGGNLRTYASGGLGLLDGLGSPDFRVTLGLRYASDPPGRNGFADSDGDGIVDRDDECREVAEDEDGFKDDDGCPEFDNDNDGVPDEFDECPETPEEAGGDQDGCPAHSYVEITDGEINIIGKVRFKSGSDKLVPQSEQLLDQLAVAFQAHPDIKSIRIEGHTDNEGNPQLNQRLSEQRAQRVKQGLVERGVKGDRLKTIGYGETRPVAPNAAPAGRAKNRRVEFLIAD